MNDDTILVHKLAIQELLSRAAYGLDERDLVMLESSFAPQAEFSMRIGDGDLIGPFVGRGEIMKLMTDSMEQQTDKRRHVASNVFFDLCTNETARVTSYLSLFATENGEIKLLTAGVYRDELINIDRQWKIQRRHLDLDKAY